MIVTAAADERVLAHPQGPLDAASAWMLLGGSMLFVAGHALFKATVWRTVPWTRLGALAALAGLALGVPFLPGLVVGALTVIVLVAVAVADRVLTAQHG